MKEPTESQIKEFWEGHGYEVIVLDKGGLFEEEPIVYFGLDEAPLEESIDLKNLFGHAVDWKEIQSIQFSKGDDGCHCWIYTKKITGKPFHGNGLTEEYALFWVLQKVKEKSNAK